MAITITPYNHTPRRIRSGANAASDDYLVTLYSVLPFDATATTKALAETGATQLPTANGYTQDSKLLTGVVTPTVGTRNAKFDADDVVWTPSGGDIGPASFALVSNGTDADDPPLYHIDFGEEVTAVLGVSNFEINWHPDGIDVMVVV